MDVVEEAIRDWAEIQDWAEGWATIQVNCPNPAPAEAGYQFLCELSDGVDQFVVRVTVLNESGDLEWEVLG